MTLESHSFILKNKIVTTGTDGSKINALFRPKNFVTVTTGIL